MFTTFRIKSMVQPHFEFFVQFHLSHLKNMMEVAEVQKKSM